MVHFRRKEVFFYWNSKSLTIYHDTECQKFVAVPGVVQDLNEGLKWQVGGNKGQCKVLRAKQPKTPDVGHITAQDHLMPNKRARVKSIGHVADERENTFKSNQSTEHYSGGDSLLFFILCQWIIRSNKHFGDATCESEDYNWHLFTVFFRCKQQKNWGNCAVLLKTQVDEKWSTTAKTFEDTSSYCTACTDSFKESLTFPEWSGLIAMPNSVWMKVWLIRWVTSLNVFP